MIEANLLCDFSFLFPVKFHAKSGIKTGFSTYRRLICTTGLNKEDGYQKSLICRLDRSDFFHSWMTDAIEKRVHSYQLFQADKTLTNQSSYVGKIFQKLFIK